MGRVINHFETASPDQILDLRLLEEGLDRLPSALGEWHHDVQERLAQLIEPCTRWRVGQHDLHSSPTARDRDRLRQDHLERLGWTFHRIWSTDWFRNREQEVERAKAVYDTAVARTDEERANGLASKTRAPSAGLEEERRPVASHAAPARSGPRPAISRGWPITEYRRFDLVRLAQWIETDNLLRTEDELLNELMRELGFKKRGSRIVSALAAAIKAARSQ